MSDGGRPMPGLYVHVPFCRAKCPYCDFYSVPSLSLVRSWLEAVECEASLYNGDFGPFDTLYVGGGTPSLLSGRDLGDLVALLHRRFTIAEESEVTIEVNPDDVTPEKVKLYLELGFNRISVGAQSFDDAILRFLKRRHTATQTERALDCIRSSGCDNLAVDLMFGIPGQTMASWIETMRRSLAFSPEHLSCYQLTIEEHTPLGRLRADGLIQPLAEDREADFFTATSCFLEEKGYLHYEISNFSRSADRTSRHNSKYWRHVPYLGLGPSAHSFRGGVRWWNRKSLEDYCRLLSGGGTAVDDSERLTAEQLKLEALYLGLRTKDGVALEAIDDTPRNKSTLAELAASGAIQIQNGKILPTRAGFLIADSLPLMLSD